MQFRSALCYCWVYALVMHIPWCNDLLHCVMHGSVMTDYISVELVVNRSITLRFIIVETLLLCSIVAKSYWQMFGVNLRLRSMILRWQWHLLMFCYCLCSDRSCCALLLSVLIWSDTSYPSLFHDGVWCVMLCCGICCDVCIYMYVVALEVNQCLNCRTQLVTAGT